MENTLKLSARLNMIANMIPECHCVCDIGTDHAYIPIWLIQNNISDKVIATDINEGPIKIANKNIESYGVAKRIQTRVGDGLECINKEECEVLLICGMGGLTITDMLEKYFSKIKCSNEIIIQCMYANEMVRKYCYKKGFEIIEENICTQRNKLYTAMKVIPTENNFCVHPAYNFVSKPLLTQDNALVLKYITSQINRLSKKREGLLQATKKNTEEIGYLTSVIKKLCELKKEFVENDSM